MPGNVNMGAATSYFGAETEAFQDGMKRMEADLNSLGQQHDKIGQLIGQSLGRVGNSYDDMGVRGARSNMLMVQGFGQLAASVQGGGVNIIGVLDMLAYHAELFEVAIAAAAGMAAMKIIATVYEMSGIKEAIATAGDQMHETAAGVMADASIYGVVDDRFATLKDQAIHLTEQLHLAVPEWVANATASEGTAQELLAYNAALLTGHTALSQYTPDITAATAALEKQRGVVDDLYNAGTNENIQLALDLVQEKSHAALVEASNKMLADNAQAVRDVAAAHEGYQLPALYKVQMALAASQEAMRQFGAETEASYGIVTKQGAADALEVMQGKLRAVALAGADSGQVLEKMGPDIMKSVEEATKMGVAVPPLMKNMAEAVKSGNDLWLGNLMDGLKKTPDAAKQAADESGKVLDEMGNRLQSSISGGFGKGIQAGTDFGKQQFDAWVLQVGNTKIPLNFDMPDLHQAVLDAVRGIIPNTAGNNP